MTDTPNTQPTLVEVSQADRLAASRVVQIAELGQAFVRGDYDEHPYVQEFARHRLASQQAAQPDPVREDTPEKLANRMGATFSQNHPTIEPKGDLSWPEGELFTFHDDPGEHAPCYVVMPGGQAIPLNHDARNGVDQARAKFIVDACNAALSQPDPVASVAVGEEDVERVARAIHATKGTNPDCLYEHHEHEKWPVDERQEYADPFSGEPRVRLMHRAWRRSEPAARAAIAALSSTPVDQQEGGV